MTHFKYALIAFAFLGGSLVQADDSGKGNRRRERKAARLECAKTVGVEIPERGPMRAAIASSTLEQREQFKGCMKQKGFEPGKRLRNGNKNEDKQ